MPRADKVLLLGGIKPPKGGLLPNDSGISTTCPSCGETQRLRDARFEEGGDGESTYTCRNGCQPILVIGKPEPWAWPGRGWRLNNWVLRNPVDLVLECRDRRGMTMGHVVMDARPAALADESERPPKPADES